MLVSWRVMFLMFLGVQPILKLSTDTTFWPTQTQTQNDQEEHDQGELFTFRMERWCLQRHPSKINTLNPKSWRFGSDSTFLFKCRWISRFPGLFIFQGYAYLHLSKISAVAGSRVGATFQATGLSSAAPTTHSKNRSTETTERNGNETFPPGYPRFWRCDGRRVETLCREPKMLQHVRNGGKRSTDKKSFHEMRKSSETKKGWH